MADIQSYDAEPEENAFVYLRGAATGDLSAIRALVRVGMSRLPDEPDLPTAIETLMFARMASVAGDQADTATLMSVLAVMIDLLDDQDDWSGYRSQLQGEGIAIANQLADAGLDVAEQILPFMVEDAGPLASEIAKDMLVRMEAI